ncbi:hypothetical protein ACRAWG_34355 [Methylobacterium sp. P31]
MYRMLKSTFLPFAAAAALLSAPFGQTAAWAGTSRCGPEIDKVQTRMPTQVNAGPAEMASAELRLAREEDMKNNEKSCLDHVSKANHALDQKTGSNQKG